MRTTTTAAGSTGRSPLLDVDGVARALGVTPRHIRRLVAERRIPFFKVGRFVRFDPGELDLWLEQQRVDVRRSASSLARPGDSLVVVQGGLESLRCMWDSVGVRLSADAICLQGEWTVTANRRHFGNVRRLPSGLYQASYWHDGRRHIAPRPSRSEADANAFLDAASAAIRRGDWIDPELGRISFARYADLWLAQRTDIRPRTREQYELLIRNKLKPAFGHHELAKVTPLHVRSWYADIAAKTPGSARSAYRLLKAIFNTAILDDLIVKNPCRVKGGGTDRVTERRIPNVDQVAALTQSMPEQYRAAVTLAAWGTLRRGEVLGLNRERRRPAGRHRARSSGPSTSSTTAGF